MDEKKALSLFNEGYNCAQIVLMGAAEQLETNPEQTIKAAAAFGSGMNRGSVCGCLTGALMALGLQYGGNSMEMTDELFDRFSAQFGGISCEKLLGGNMGNPADRERIEKEGLTLTRCPRFAAAAADILNDLLED